MAFVLRGIMFINCGNWLFLMKNEEFMQVLAGVLVLFVVISFGFILDGEWAGVVKGAVFSVLIVGVHVLGKKWAAGLLDCDVEHKIWSVYRYGLKPHHHFKKEMPFGIIVPLFFLFFSVVFLWPLGIIFKFMGILTYEARALKRRAAKRFGPYSYTELTEWHNGLIGAVGIVGLMLLAVISYFIGFGDLSRVVAYYMFWNMLPISNLDGAQILFGNRILYSVLGVITLLFTAYALILPV